MNRIDEIRERCEAATTGKLQIIPSNDKDFPYGVFSKQKNYAWVKWGEFGRKQEAEFFAHARDDIPFLLTEIERLKTQVGELLKALEGKPNDVQFDIDDEGFLFCIKSAFRNRFGMTMEEFEKMVDKLSQEIEDRKNPKPLTLEELKEVDGEVWICYPQPTFGKIQTEEPLSCSRYNFSLSDYGKSWIAYRCKPKETNHAEG